MTTEVKVPTLGESITEATVGQWLKAPGDAVKADEPIVSLETDKVAIEVPSPVDGVMGEQIAKVGDTVTIGSLIARIEAGAGVPANAAPLPPAGGATRAASGGGESAPAPTPAAQAETSPPPAPPAAVGDAFASTGRGEEGMPPAVRRLIDDYNLDSASLTGTGKDGRLTKADVLAAMEAGTAKTKSAPLPPAGGAGGGATAASPPPPTPPAAVGDAFASTGRGARNEERIRMTRLRQTIARRLKEAQNTAAMLTTFNDVDMTAVMAARTRYKDLFEKKHGVRLGFMSFFAKACVLALRDVPAVNARIDGEEIVYHDYADLGIAVSSPGGLVVPVLKDAGTLSFAQTEKAIGDFGKRAQAGALTLADMQGGTFTITNGGVFGSLMSTPILNTPQSGVLGMHRIEDRPVVRDGQIVIRPMMYLALSYDHRIVDGREAVTFLVRIKEAIEDPARLLIDL